MFTEAPAHNWCVHVCVQQSCTHRPFNVTSAGVRISTAFCELKLHYHCWELSRSSRSRVYECATMVKSPNGLAGSVFNSKFFSLQRCKAQMKHTLVETFSFFYVLSWRFRTPIIILPKEVPRSSVLSCENVHAPRYRPSEAVAMSSLLFIIVIPKPSNTKPSKPYPLGFETWLAAESHACRWFSHHKPPFRHYPMVFASNKATPSHSQLHFQAKRLQHWDSRSRLWAWHWLSWRPSPESCGSLSTLLRRLQGLSPDIPRDVSSPTSHPQQINTQEAGSCLTHLRAEITTWNVAWGLWIVTDTLRSTDGTFSTWKDWSILVKVACKRIQPYDPAFLTLLDTSGRTSVNCEHQIHIMQPISCHFSGIKNSIPPIELVWT